ncbi:alpha/beta hydrolase [Mycobacterium antarcticum]|uniref:alpha/beta hydrolase n=1 Tax=Mycolicibacterium sp. TUM20984 TaxID=3023368 RepID=UPI00238AA390|nr:alpha/beta fold hydrolase [Mycolicibacterium sp. TUM20984]GLP82738.1 hypothetical protein TUM20984_41580 [Mycolicibacterium sp. TUM20984]
MNTREYGPGRLADVFGEPSQPTVLLWHGMQTDARASVRTLAQSISHHDVAVVAPDWDSHAPDGGRAALLESIDFARRIAADPDGMVLVGWSMGGLAAAALTVNSASFNVSFAHTVCLAGAFSALAPISGRLVADDVRAAGVAAGSRTPFTLLHGTSDDVVPVSTSAAFADALRRADWPVEFEELDADHGSIAGAAYDPDLEKYLPAQDRTTMRVADAVAARIAALIGR